MQSKYSQTSGAPLLKVLCVFTVTLCIAAVLLSISVTITRNTLSTMEQRLDRLEKQLKSSEKLHQKLGLKYSSDHGTEVRSNAKNRRFVRSIEQAVRLDRDTRTSEQSRVDSNIFNKKRNKAEKKTNRRRHKKSKSRKDKVRQAKAVHFEAFVDNTKHLRMTESEQSGHYDSGAYVSNDKIFNMWKAAEEYDEGVFRFNQSSGKLTVETNGLYLLYVQVVFHDLAARKSIGIHIDDPAVPFVESLAFDTVTQSRLKRALSQYTKQSADGAVNKTEPMQGDQPLYDSLYNQCSCMGVHTLRKGQEVFIKTLEKERGVVDSPYLTYWGVVRIA